MKKSEFRRRVSRECPNVSSMVVLAEEAGVQWDPEETELPDRVQKSGFSCVLVPFGMSAVGMGSVDLEIAIANEAAARYNAVSTKIHRLKTDGLWLRSDLCLLLEEERGKLRAEAR